MSPVAVFAAKLYLIAFFCLSFFFTLIGLFLGESLFSSLYSLLKSFIYSFVWFLYLSLSRRVRNTYRSQKRLVRDWIIFAVVLSTPFLLIFAGVLIDSDESSGAVEKGFIEFDIPKGREFNREYYKGVPVYYFEKPGTLLVLLTVEHDGSAREFMDDSFDDLLLKYFEGAEYGLVSDSKGRTSEGYGYVERVTAVEEGDMYLFGVRVFEMQGYVAVLAFSSWLEDSEDTDRIVDSLSDSLVLDDW